MKVLHIITSLSTGGAERALSRIVNNKKDKSIEYKIVTLFDFPKSYNIDESIEVIELNKKLTNINKILIVKDLILVLYKINPDIIQFWMKTNIYSIFIKMFFLKKIIVSNYRNSYYAEDRLSKYLTKLSSRFSHGNIFVSEKAMKERINNNFSLKNPVVIGNGFTVNNLKEINIDRKSLTFGYIGRYHPVKNQQLLIDAINMFHNSDLDIKFIIAGRDLNASKFEWVSENVNIEWLGEISQTDKFYKKIDVLVLTSLSEGFPNVIGEAMSYGIPVITTDAGASWEIIKDSGYRIRTSRDLYATILYIYSNIQELEEKSIKAYNLIRQKHSISSTVQQYENYYNLLRRIKK